MDNPQGDRLSGLPILEREATPSPSYSTGFMAQGAYGTRRRRGRQRRGGGLMGSRIPNWEPPLNRWTPVDLNSRRQYDPRAEGTSGSRSTWHDDDGGFAHQRRQRNYAEDCGIPDYRYRQGDEGRYTRSQRVQEIHGSSSRQNERVYDNERAAGDYSSHGLHESNSYRQLYSRAGGQGYRGGDRNFCSSQRRRDFNPQSRVYTDEVSGSRRGRGRVEHELEFASCFETLGAGVAGEGNLVYDRNAIDYQYVASKSIREIRENSIGCSESVSDEIQTLDGGNKISLPSDSRSSLCNAEQQAVDHVTQKEIGNVSLKSEFRRLKTTVPQLVQELEEKLTRGTVECMICYEMVGRASAVWNCGSCYSTFHLHCIKTWARAPTSADLSVSNDISEGNWRCPGCQKVEFIIAKDLRYVCFCGQVENPDVDHYLTPHSCGSPCRKSLDKSMTNRCHHICTMRCHPGPCPPCTAMAPIQTCSCGKNSFTRRCGEHKEVSSCGQVCGKLLLCGRHYCSQICHEGPCERCVLEVKIQCFCGAKQQVLACGHLEIHGEIDFGIGNFSCGKICMGLLTCEKHKCKKCCHLGSCGECELSPDKLQTCPCRKKSLEELLGHGSRRNSCTDPIPCCGQTCEKLLPCQKHTCPETCHLGSCSPCHIPVQQKCRCGSLARSAPCHISLQVDMPYGVCGENLFTCERKCGQKMTCGRHRCNNRCCPSLPDGGIYEHGSSTDPHFCLLSCGKRLRCRQHDCQELCHSGHCPPCLESIFTELSCPCGRTFLTPPIPCGTPLPSCPYKCVVPQACGHEVTHLCHPGSCPPCTVLVAKECVGNHVLLRGVPCGSRDVKCNTLCGKLRECGLHACGRACHVPPCDSKVECSDRTDGSVLKLSCGQPCRAPRKDCSHICVATCHPLSSCPATRCTNLVKITCACGHLMGEVPCNAGPGTNNIEAPDTKMILSRLPGPLQPLILVNEHTPLGQRKLACNDECAKLEKKRILANAFGVDLSGEAGPSGDGRVLGSEALTDILHRDPQWVIAVEDRFRSLLFGTKGSSRIRVHVFCVMSREKRELLYQLAERWLLGVSSAGREPRRFVVVHVTNKSKVPSLRLLSRTSPASGQLLIPNFSGSLDMDPAFVVAFLDIPRDVDVRHLILRFAGECELLWLNDKNALAIFGDVARATTALRRVEHTSAYKGAALFEQSTCASSLGALGPKTGASCSKPTSRKNNVQESSWSDHGWGGDRSVVKIGSTSNTINTSKNPWVALDHTSGQVSGLALQDEAYMIVGTGKKHVKEEVSSIADDDQCRSPEVSVDISVETERTLLGDSKVTSNGEKE